MQQRISDADGGARAQLTRFCRSDREFYRKEVQKSTSRAGLSPDRVQQNQTINP